MDINSKYKIWVTAATKKYGDSGVKIEQPELLSSDTSQR